MSGLLTHQLRAPHAASDNTHIILLISKLVFIAPALFPSVFPFCASSLQFADVSDTSSLCFCGFFLCFTSVGILAHWHTFTVKEFNRPKGKIKSKQLLVMLQR